MGDPLVFEVNPNSYDSEQVSCFWVALIVRFKYRQTMETGRLFEKKYNVSNPELDAMEEQDPIFVENDVTAWNVSQGKESFMGSCSLQLVHSEKDYTKEVVPGDWLMFWVVNSKAEYTALVDKINKREQCNDAKDGLKFVGRIQGVKRKVQRLMNGHLNISYSITAASFSELSNQIFYDPMLMGHYSGPNGDVKFWLDLGQSIDKLLLLRDDNQKVLASHNILPALLYILLGKGTGSVAKELPSAEDNPLKALGMQTTPNDAYLIPKTITQLMFKKSGTLLDTYGLTSYAELLKVYIGIQNYTGGTNQSPYSLFLPDLKRTDHPNVYECPNKLDGQILAIPTPWTGQTVWNILGSYLNSPVDEMYTCLRVADSGKVYPTLVIRQTAYNTREFADGSKLPVTSFVSLPRWKISSKLIFGFDHGTSESCRFNYIHFLGRSNIGIEQEQLVAYDRNPPLTNVLDIRRSGLKMKRGQVNANLNERGKTTGESPGGFWQALIADALMDGHLKHSGTLSCVGIYEPICVGDNTEIDNMIFHIERVSHIGSIGMDGKKIFSTSLDVSNGVSIQNDRDFKTFRSTDDIVVQEPVNRG